MIEEEEEWKVQSESEGLQYRTKKTGKKNKESTEST